MIEVDLPDGPASTLVRGLAACLSSVTEAPPIDLPDVGDAPVEHALGAWLARKPRLQPRPHRRPPVVPVGRLVDRLRQYVRWAGGGPGVRHPARRRPAPQDPALLGRATADLDISGAWAVASLGPVLATVAAGPGLTGTVELLAVEPRAEAPMRLLEQARALAGRGLEGDRYADGAGRSAAEAPAGPAST